MLSENEKKEILGKLIIDNRDLDLLESKLSNFNIFEAIGVIRQEIRHSNFLAFLLNPSATHRLGDLFLKQLLIRTFVNTETPPFSPIEIDITNLEDAEVRREWKNIDILIYSPSNRLVCVIENKIDSSEHSNQLERYMETVSIEFPGCRNIFLYLTNDGYSASNERWLSLSYEEVTDAIESIYTKYRSTIGDEVFTLMSHYVSLVRSHIMSSSEIANLCQKIYKQHRQALDLIYEHRPDLQSEISEFVETIIQENRHENIEKDDSTKQYIRFAPKEWDNLAFQKTCHEWTSSRRILLFEFVNEPKYLGLHLIIGPGNGEVKRAIFDMVKELKISGIVKSHLKETGWSHICKRTILRDSDYIDEDWESLQKKIKDFFQKYLEYDAKLIRQAISASPLS